MSNRRHMILQVSEDCQKPNKINNSKKQFID